MVMGTPWARRTLELWAMRTRRVPLRELRGEGRPFSPFFPSCHGCNPPPQRRCVDAVLPIADKLGLRIVDDDAWQSGLVSDDEGKVLGLVDLIGAGQGRHLIGRQAHDK